MLGALNIYDNQPAAINLEVHCTTIAQQWFSACFLLTEQSKAYVVLRPTRSVGLSMLLQFNRSPPALTCGMTCVWLFAV